MEPHITYERKGYSSRECENLYYYKKSVTGELCSESDIFKVCDMLTATHDNYEVLRGNRYLKPFFIYRHTSNYEITETLIYDHFLHCKGAITSFFKRYESTWSFDRDVAVAYVLFDENGRYELQLRFCVICGCYTTLDTLYQLVKVAVPELSVFDVEVYSHDSVIAMLNASPFGTASVFEPFYANRWFDNDFIVQYIPPHFGRELRCSIHSVMIRRGSRYTLCRELLEITPIGCDSECSPDCFDFDFDRNDVGAMLNRLPNDEVGRIGKDVWITIAHALIEAKRLGQIQLSLKDLKELFVRFSDRHPESSMCKTEAVFVMCVDCAKYNVGVLYIEKLIERLYPTFWRKYELYHEKRRLADFLVN